MKKIKRALAILLVMIVSFSVVSVGAEAVSVSLTNSDYGYMLPANYNFTKTVSTVYLNGSYIHPEEAVNTVLSLPLSEVESMIYVSGVSAAPFQPSFDSGDVSPYPVLMVRTKPHVRADQIPYNVSCDYPLGWQKPVKFYTPKYDSAEARKSGGKDSRITLYWNPSVKVDANGEAWISFYTSDSASEYRIEVEGRSANRQYHYVEKIVSRKR